MAKASFSKQSRAVIALFNDNKLLILNELYNCRSNVCGCDLVAKLGLPKNLVSYHIRKLRESGYVSEVRCGKKKHYRIAAGQNKIVKQILKLIHFI